MKTPGIFYRVSFLLILHTLVIFATVTIVSIRNNQAKIDRLITYNSGFITNYFRAEFGSMKPSETKNGRSAQISQSGFDSLFNRSSRYLTGMAGISLLYPAADSIRYLVRYSSLCDPLRQLPSDDFRQVVPDPNIEIIKSSGIFVGRKTATDAGYMKTIYIPLKPHDVNNILAITFAPRKIVGGDSEYNYTLILLFLSITLVILLVVHFMFRSFISPLRQLILGMEKTMEGVSQYTIDIVKDDEIGQVAATFNKMSVALWEKQRQVIESNKNLIESNRKLSQTLDKISELNISLTESESFLSKLIENSPFGIIVTDIDKSIMIFSQHAMLLFEVKPDKAMECDVHQFFPYAANKVFPEDDTAVKTEQQEMICCKSTGETFPALVCRVPIKDGSYKINAYLYIIRDISESRGFHEMMISIDRMATRGVMAGEVAHEINNYLAVILGNVELLPLLLAKGEMEKFNKKLDVLKTSVFRIQQFAEGMMGYGNEDIIIEPGDLNQIIGNLIAFLRPQNRYDSITFDLSLSHKLPLVQFDSGQIQQMLVNLLSNAADALREKKYDRLIKISTNLSQDNQSAIITITDNASGLPNDIDSVIFKKRYTGRRRGRGFGFLIVGRIIEKHNGTIRHQSFAGQGSSFIIELPITADAAKAVPDTPTSDKVIT